MLGKDSIQQSNLTTTMAVNLPIPQIRPAQWHLVGLVSLVVGLGSALRTELLPPVLTTVIMTLTIFVGWYVWGGLTYLADVLLFGGHNSFRNTLNAFGLAYLFQALCVLANARPLNWLWCWVGLYATVAAWGVIGPRRLDMRTWQAIVAAFLGLLVWLGCQILFTLNFTWNGLFAGVGVFLI